METWYNEQGTVAFLGDACHPMLPYLAQGAGSALEDGATLGVLLSKAGRREDVPELLKLYEQLRKPRSSALQKRSMTQVGVSPFEINKYTALSLIRSQRYTNHLHNGPEQEQRDRVLEQQLAEPQPGYPFYWYGHQHVLLTNFDTKQVGSCPAEHCIWIQCVRRGQYWAILISFSNTDVADSMQLERVGIRTRGDYLEQSKV